MAQNDADTDDRTAYETLDSLNEGDTFTASRLRGEWVVENVNEDAADGTNVIAYQRGKDHFALKFEGKRTTQNVTPRELVEGDAEEMGIHDLPADTPVHVEERAVELDPENAHEKPVSATEAPGSTFAVVVEERFGDGSTHTDHYTEAQARNIFAGLRAILDDEEEDLLEIDPEDVHEHPVRVRESTGVTYAVVVEEKFGDGSTHKDHYTETQARKLLSDLRAIFDDRDDERRSVRVGNTSAEPSTAFSEEDVSALSEVVEKGAKVKLAYLSSSTQDVVETSGTVVEDPRDHGLLIVFDERTRDAEIQVYFGRGRVGSVRRYNPYIDTNLGSAVALRVSPPEGSE